MSTDGPLAHRLRRSSILVKKWSTVTNRGLRGQGRAAHDGPPAPRLGIPECKVHNHLKSGLSDIFRARIAVDTQLRVIFTNEYAIQHLLVYP